MRTMIHAGSAAFSAPDRGRWEQWWRGLRAARCRRGQAMSPDPLAGVTDAQLAQFFEHQVQSRPITVDVSRSTERRLRRYLATVDRYESDDPIGQSDSALALAIISAADSGLREAETEDGVWTGIDGAEHPLPLPVRAPVMMRAKFCWRAARDMWRST